MYFLCTVTGETRWIFKTGDAVKSSPAVDPVTGLVIVGSHDGTVYGLNPEVRSIIKSAVLSVPANLSRCLSDGLHRVLKPFMTYSVVNNEIEQHRK